MPKATSTPTTSDDDPHVAWSRTISDLMVMARDAETDEEQDVLGRAMDRLRDLIAKTPARTPAGITAKIRLAIACDADGSVLGRCEVRALRSAVAAISQLRPM
jgi:hypothetical protein